MSKKLFRELIKKASTPVPKEQDKQLHPEDYNETKTHQDKIANTSVKPSDMVPSIERFNWLQ